MPSQSRNPSVSESSGGDRALVRWRDGKYKGAYTHNVSLDWVLNYDPTCILPETYAVEWRQPPKPKNGWPVLNADILEISGEFDTASVWGLGGLPH